MAKSKKRCLTGRQIGILAILIEQNIKQFSDPYGIDVEAALRKAVNKCSELPKWSAKILDEPVEMLFEYYGVL